MGFSLFGSSGSKSTSTSETNTFTRTANIGASGGALVASDQSSVSQTIYSLDPEVANAALDFGGDALDYSYDIYEESAGLVTRSLDTVDESVDSVLNLGRDYYGQTLDFTSDLITLEADRRAESNKQVAQSLGDAYSAQIQGGIDTQKILTIVIAGGLVLGGIALFKG